MRFLGRLAVPLVLALIMANCARERVRADVVDSPAGMTFLVVSRKVPCPAVMIDGAPWPTPRDKPGEISPGRHQIACGGEKAVTFKIEQGTTVQVYGWER